MNLNPIQDLEALHQCWQHAFGERPGTVSSGFEEASQMRGLALQEVCGPGQEEAD